MSVACDHKDPGSIAFDARANSFRCLICETRLVVEPPPTAATVWSRRLVWAAVLCVLIALGATAARPWDGRLYTIPTRQILLPKQADARPEESES